MRPRPLRESLSFVALLSLCFVAAALPADAQTVREDGRIVFASVTTRGRSTRSTSRPFS
jgi:hypothetical protein